MVLAYLRTPPRVIGMVLGIAGDILDRVYASELKHGANIVTAKLGMRAVAAALKGDKAALTLIARAQGVGKPEKPDDIPTNDPKKVEDEPIDLAKFSLADLQGILKELDS